MTELIIYLIGYVLSYYVCRKRFRLAYQDNYSWEIVFWICILSLGSFVTLVMTLTKRYRQNIKIKKIKPPKFL